MNFEIYKANNHLTKETVNESKEAQNNKETRYERIVSGREESSDL